MTNPAAPLIDIQGLVKNYQGLRPLRMRALIVNPW